MSTLLSIKKLIKQIREGLAGEVTVLTAEELATEYTRLAHEAAQRLEACAVMIDKGSDYQALQLAETEPALLDVLAALSFAEAPQWTAYCAVRSWPAAPRFDARAVIALDGLYARGITTQHPLYKDYRAAVTSRDDAHAIQIIRTIVRLNPDDANARAELQRLENKLFQHGMQELRAALAKGEHAAILAQVEELERLAPAARLEEQADYRQGREVRRLAKQRGAEVDAARLAAGLAEERAENNWRKAAGMILQIETLQADFGFVLGGTSAEQVAEARAWTEGERAEAEQAVKFLQAIQALGEYGSQIETRLLRRSTLTAPEAEQLYLDFNRRWKEVEHFGRSVPEEVVEQVRKVAAALRAELDRLQKRKRMVLGVSTAAASLAFGALAWFVIEAYRTQDYVQQLGVLKERGQVETAEKMIADLREERPHLTRRPVLQARLDSVENWVRDERARLTSVNEQIASLESSVKGLSEGDPVAFNRQLAGVADAAEKLPEGLNGAPLARIVVLRNLLDADLATRRERLDAQAETELARLEEIAAKQLGYDQSKAALESALGEIEPKLAPMLSRIGSALPALELPAALAARATALRQRAETFRQELNLLRQTHEALLVARTLEEYRAALGGFKDSRLAQVPEVTQARQLLAVFPDPDAVLAALLIPGDPAGWLAAKNEGEKNPFIPDTVLPAEMTKLLALREDPYLHEIWQATLADLAKRGEKREIYARGEIKKNTPYDAGPGMVVSNWSGAFYDPAQRTEVPAFGPATYTFQKSTAGTGGTGELSGIRRSAASDCLARLELNRMTDADGAKYEKAFLKVCEDLVRHPQAPALFKAYLLQEIGKLIAARPYAWGLHYCASLKTDLAKLTELCGTSSLRSMDWLLLARREALEPALAPFIEELKTRAYVLEAEVHRKAVREALTAGLRYGGFIDGDGRMQLLGEAGATKDLWVMTLDGKVVAPLKLGNDVETAQTNYVGYSAIFFVPVDREKLLSAPGAREALKTGNIPLLD